MADERIEVEYIATQQQVLQAFEKLNRRLDTTEKKLEKTGTTSKKAAKLAEGSFAALEKELKDNETALKRMVMGTKEFEAQRAKVDRLRKALSGARGELGAVAQKTSGISTAAAAGVTAVGGMVVKLAGLHAIVSSVTAELEKGKRLQVEAAATERTFEQALADIGQNIGGENIGAARVMIQQQAPGLGVTQEGLANLMGTAISAGAKDLEEAMKLSAATLKLTVGDAQRAQALVGGTLDVASLGGTKDFQAALGQLIQTQSQVRSTNLAEFAANIGPGLAAATASTDNMAGVSTERALEISSIVSQIIKDQTGANTATTMRQFFGRLGSFAPSESVKLDDGTLATLTENQIAAFKAANTFDERLAQMRQNPALMNQFLETQRESIGKVAVREIISGSERAVGFEQKAQAAITSLAESGDTFTTLVGAVKDATPALAAQRRSEANLQKAQTTGVAGVLGQARSIFESTVENIDLPGIDAVRVPLERRKLDAAIAGGRNPIEATIEAINSAITAKGLGELDIRQEERQYAQEQIELLRDLKIELQRLRQEQVRPAQPIDNKRPKEAPLPAALLP